MFVARGQVFKDIESRKTLTDHDFFKLQMLYSTTLVASLGLVDMYDLVISSRFAYLTNRGDSVSYSGEKSIWLCPKVGAPFTSFMAACQYPTVRML